jgi:hypothetical protein
MTHPDDDRDFHGLYERTTAELRDEERELRETGRLRPLDYGDAAWRHSARLTPGTVREERGEAA